MQWKNSVSSTGRQNGYNMKLTAKQIGRLARHIELVVERHKDDPPPSLAKDLAKTCLDRMDPWEVELKSLVDTDPDLPAYDDTDIHIMEMLTHYFSED